MHKIELHIFITVMCPYVEHTKPVAEKKKWEILKQQQSKLLTHWNELEKTVSWPEA